MFHFIDINRKLVSPDIETIFPGYIPGDERIAVLSPHDDDAIIGASYIMRAAMAAGAEVFVVIFCQGNAGYSHPNQKDTIVEVRKQETYNAYKKIGINANNIYHLDYPDFSVASNIGWFVPADMCGSFERMMRLLRTKRITRVLVPNANREHSDHTAVNKIGSFDSPQAGDPILVDWALPNIVRSMLEYAVWSDLSPEDALVCGRDLQLRANSLVVVPEIEEQLIVSGIAAYQSQGKIINDMIARRKERKMKDGEYIEPYLIFDPRPKMNYSPYIAFAEKLMEASKL